MANVSFQVGWTRTDLLHYQVISRKGLIGADIKAIDGKGNKIEVGVREHGFVISVNGKDIASELDSYSTSCDSPST